MEEKNESKGGVYGMCDALEVTQHLLKGSNN